MKKLVISAIILLASAFSFSAVAQEELPVTGASGKINGRVISFADYETTKMKIMGTHSSFSVGSISFGKNLMTNKYTITGPEGSADVNTQEDKDRYGDIASAAALGIKVNNDFTFGCTITDPEGNEWHFALGTLPNKSDRECGVIEGPVSITIFGDNDNKPLQMQMKTNFHYTFQVDGEDLCTIRSIDKKQTIILSDKLTGNLRLVIAAAASAILARVGVPLGAFQ